MGSRSFILKTIFPAIGLSLFVYISHQLFRAANPSKLIMALGLSWVFLVTTMTTLLPVMFWMDETRGEKSWHLLFHEVSHRFMGYFSYILFMVLSRDIIAFILSFTSFQIFSYSLIETTAILTLPLLFMLLGYATVVIGPYVKNVDIKIEGVPQELRGLTIAQISDLHIGPAVDVERVRKVVKKTNSARADIIVLTGDIIDYHVDHFEDEIMELKNLTAKYGVYFAVGNHEYFWNYHQTTAAIRKTGIKLLINETQKLNLHGKVVTIGGASDPMARFFDHQPPQYEKLNDEAKDSDLRIILCHQPNQADLVKKYSFHLQLSGHTHRGQFIPWSWMIRIFQKYIGGLFTLGGLKLYVNQGTGFWGPPDRFGTYCEITKVQII